MQPKTPGGTEQKVLVLTTDNDRQTKRWLSLLVLLTCGVLLLAITNFAWARPQFSELVKQAAPAVVAIHVAHTAKTPVSVMPELPNNEEVPEFFRRFFEQIPRGQQAPDRQAQGQGSGFIIDADGYVLTNAHVVRDAENITVSLSDRREYQAKLIGADDRTDIALLKIDTSDLPTVNIGDSDQLEVGEWVLAIGSPFGFEHTATQGIVSALSRSLPDETYVPFIQTDVAVNPGNSGGPLFNESGEVVGVNSQIYSRTGGYMGLSFAIPINVAMDVSEQLKTKGHVRRGWLGVTIQDMNQALAESFGLDKPTGALVANVGVESPAEKAGIQNGDVILRFNGKPVNRSGDLPPLVGATAIGKKVSVDVLRKGKKEEILVKIGELAADQVAQGPAGVTEPSGLGIVIGELDQEQRQKFGDRGLLVKEVNPNGPAAVAGIRAGDVILSYNHKDVKTSTQLSTLVKESPKEKPIAILVQRNQTTQYLALTIPKA